MTAAQRRTVSVTIGGPNDHQVTIMADVRSPAELTELAEKVYERTRPQTRVGVGFGTQYAERTIDRAPAGSPWHVNPTSKAGEQ